MTVPGAVPILTFTTSGKFAVAPTATAAFAVHVTVPVAPTAGVEHVQPTGCTNETNVVFAGRGSENVAPAATAGPLLVTVCVYVMLFPSVTGFGEAELVT